MFNNCDISLVKQNHSTREQQNNRKYLEEILNTNLIPNEHKINNLGLFLKTGSLSHILFVNEVYRLIKDLPGVIMEFGVWYGQNQILFENLRAIYEPFNKLRKIIGFDTFSGYPNEYKTEKENLNQSLNENIYSINEDCFNLINKTVEFHQKNNILPQKLINELVRGKVEDTLEIYLHKNPHTIISLIYLDLALYKSTKYVLEKIKPYLIKGSVIIFDEFNHPEFVGDTLAFREVLHDVQYEIKLSEFMREKTILTIK